MATSLTKKYHIRSSSVTKEFIPGHYQIHESFENDSYTLGGCIDLYKYLALIIKLLKKLEKYEIKGKNLA